MLCNRNLLAAKCAEMKPTMQPVLPESMRLLMIEKNT